MTETSKEFIADYPGGAYPVRFDAERIPMHDYPLGGRRFCITDSNVADIYLHGGPLLPDVEHTIIFAAGEPNKKLSVVEHVLSQLAAAGATREDHIIALGGGVVGDLAGLCAHLYQRGIPVIQVPTTLVAMADAAYGGKTGVNLTEAKNYVGAYHQPSAVLVWPGFLETLPAQELGAGFVEVIKTGLLSGGDLWRQVQDVTELTSEGLTEIIYSCARYKCRLVADDQYDDADRRTLNLGHTVGHAIEAVTGYERYLHGQAVGLGMLAALRLSGADELRAQVKELLDRHQLPTMLPADVDADDILIRTHTDKKITAGEVEYVLLPTPGDAVRRHVDDADVLRAIKELY